MLTSISAHEGSNKLFTRNSLLRKFSFLLSRIVHLNQYATLPSLAPVGDVAPFTTNLLPRNVICVADTIALSAIYENYMHWEVTITLAPEGDVDPNDKNLLPGTFSVKRKTMYLTKYTLANKWWAITLAPAGGAELSTKNLSPRTPNSATNKKAYWTKFALCLYKLMRIALTPKGSTELCTKQLQDLLSCTPYPNKTHATLISRFYDNPDCKLLEDHHTRTKILNFNSTPFQLTSCTSQYGWNGNEKATDTDLPKLLTTPGDRILSTQNGLNLTNRAAQRLICGYNSKVLADKHFILDSKIKLLKLREKLIRLTQCGYEALLPPHMLGRLYAYYLTKKLNKSTYLCTARNLTHTLIIAHELTIRTAIAINNMSSSHSSHTHPGGVHNSSQRPQYKSERINIFIQHTPHANNIKVFSKNTHYAKGQSIYNYKLEIRTNLAIHTSLNDLHTTFQILRP
jgi:hypothetical protein